MDEWMLCMYVSVCIHVLYICSTLFCSTPTVKVEEAEISCYTFFFEICVKTM